MIFAYRVLTAILYPFLILLIYCRKILKKEDPVRFKEKFLISHFNIRKKNKNKLIWFHAASIGEFKSIIPIINQLNTSHKNFQFLITTTTLSSGNLANIILKKFNNVEHRFFPMDIKFLIDNFMYLWKPDRIFLVDSEIWPNLILNAKKYNIPIALINARLTSRTFKKWMIFQNTAKKIFGIFNLCMCSNIETQDNLKKLGANNIFFKGNIKLIDNNDLIDKKDPNEDILLNKRLWLAVSTHREEEKFCLETHTKLKEKFRNIILIIAPRHTERVNEIKSLFEKSKMKVQILNKNERISENVEIVIINFFGALRNYLKNAKSVFIGKSIIKRLKDDGGQNPIEAAKLGCKIYHGPYVYNFKEIYEFLDKENISFKVENFEQLSENLSLDLENFQKESFQIPMSIKNLEQKTLTDTMKLINNFLKYDGN